MDEAGYADFARRLWATGLVADPWVDGAPRFRQEPLVVPAARGRALCAAAEAVALAYDEVNQLCVDDPSLLASYFHLTPWQRAMWAASGGAWHCVARADVFVTAEGPRVCELNSDTPTGQVEATVLASLTRPADVSLRDPNEALLDRFVDAVAREAREVRAGAPGDPWRVGVVYPTDLSEDLGLVALYRARFEARGWRVALGAPRDVTAGDDDGVRVAGEPCDVVLRHYKTDAWGERAAPWRTVPPPPDAGPMVEPLTALLRAVVRGRCAVVNPFGAVLTQNKRAMALMWEARDRLSPEARGAVERYVPFTARLEELGDALDAKDDWVLKPDYGCEGEGVVIGRDVTAAAWREALADARPGCWVAQRYFEAERDGDGRCVNHGVYVVAGRACGMYGRVHAGATDRRALSAGVWLEDDG